LDRYYHYF